MAGISQGLGGSEPVISFCPQVLAGLHHIRRIEVEQVDEIASGAAQSSGEIRLGGPYLDDESAVQVGYGEWFLGFQESGANKGKAHASETAQKR